MKEDKKQILVCGNYGASNLGDEAILGGIVALIKSSFPNAEITAMSSSPVLTAKQFKIESCDYFPAGFKSFFRFWLTGRGWRTMKTLSRADLVLLGGGGLFSDENPRAVWIWFVQFFWFWLFRKPVICIAQSVGPLHSSWAKALTGFVFRNAKAVTVRDKKSKSILENLKVEKVEVLADPAYAIGYDIDSFHKKSPQVVVTARKWSEKIDQEKSAILAEFVDWLWEKHGLKTVFLPFQTRGENDCERYQQILLRLKNREAMELKIPEDYLQAMEIIGRSELVVGMRLHSIIFAVLAKTPFVALSYSKKVMDFTDTIGLGEFSLDYQEFDLKKLQQKLEKALEQRKELREKLEKAKLTNTYAFFRHEKILRQAFEL